MPHSGVGGAEPSPKKLKVENISILFPISVVAMINTELTLFG